MNIRIDDIGASTKKFNQHGKKIFKIKNITFFYFPFSNFWFFKTIPPFRGWAPYEELTKEEWADILKIFKENNLKPIIAITACWVDEKNKLTPFPEKFPREAAILKEAFLNDEIIVANHGLTHCIVGKHLPRFFRSNREFQREFWPQLEEAVHDEHIQKSQEILEKYFQKPIEIFVPPGNVWSKKTYEALKKTSIKKIICNQYMMDSNEQMNTIEFIDDRKDFFNLHDMELKRYGKKWLRNELAARLNK